MKILLATNNQGKVREYKELLLYPSSTATSPSADECMRIDIVTPAELNLDLDVEETGDTFQQNAIIKAKAFAAASGLPALADDSGLEVDALGGEPGIHSARYSGPTDEDRMRAVLTKLQGVPSEKRTARFRCVVALATPEGKVWTSAGACEGVISLEPIGLGGFGYDPIFYIPSLNRTMAQIPRSLKNQISHRALAVLGIRDALLKLVDRC